MAMLREVLDGDTYETVAERHGMTRTAVERRVKNLMRVLDREVGIEGLNPDAMAFVQRLRQCRIAILNALSQYTPIGAMPKPARRILSDAEIELAMRKTRAYSANPARDVALLSILLSTGAKPLEIARLEIADYLDREGQVRQESLMRPEVATNRRARPLFFASATAVQAIDNYLAQRTDRMAEVTGPFRGFNAGSRLLLDDSGQPFEIIQTGTEGQMRYLCRSMLDTCRKIFRRIGLEGTSAVNLRRTVAARMQARGASLEQIGEILGIGEAKAVRELLPVVQYTLGDVVRDLV